MNTGLFFGSFNPIHIGHLALANYFVEFTDIEKLWFVVSPQNPLKERKTLLADNHRLYMVRLAIENKPDKYFASNIEFEMPKPSYTIDTLAYLKDKYPDKEFVLIMGADNLINLHKWKNYKEIVNNYQIYVYPRPETDLKNISTEINYKIFDAPVIEISSSFIRDAISKSKDVTFFMPEAVAKYVEEMNFYRKNLE